MAEQLTLLGQREARDRALARVERPAWQSFALRAIRYLAADGGPFTSNDVWTMLDAWAIPRPIEPRAMGAAMNYARRHHWIVATGAYRVARDPASRNHARPQAEYRGR